jgi:hypothetical protein
MKIKQLSLKEALKLATDGNHNSSLYVIRADDRSIKPFGEHSLDYLKINENNRYVAIVEFVLDA